MKKIQLFILTLIICGSFVQCKSGRIITKAIAPKDTTNAVVINNVKDSINLVNEVRTNLAKTKIDFKTFSAKIKLDIEKSKGRMPDLNANVKIIKDSVIWISISAIIVGVPAEVFRVYIKKDSVTVIDKQQKDVHYRSIDYLQEMTNIPFDFMTIQDMLLGNPVFFNEKDMTVKKFEKFLLISSMDKGFKNLITLNSGSNLLEHCKLDDTDIYQNRTADFTYQEYETKAGFPFATQREVLLTEKNKIDIKMQFKQYEFNKELSLNFSVPKSYKKN
jgi:Domain of unknown function (DUF4292)